MMSIYELAKLIKDAAGEEAAKRDYLGPQVGKVAQTTPDLSFSIGDAIIVGQDVIVPTIDTSGLVAGEEVVLLPSADNQRWFLVGRVVR